MDSVASVCQPPSAAKSKEESLSVRAFICVLNDRERCGQSAFDRVYFCPSDSGPIHRAGYQNPVPFVSHVLILHAQDICSKPLKKSRLC